MGICTSSEATSVATAKLILQNGKLEEFSYPVKASYLLSKDPTTFICHSDDMDFDGVVSAIRDDEELEPGQLYFALPRAQLNRPLSAEEMAALAVKANAALLKSHSEDNKCRGRKKSGFFGGGECDQREDRSSAKVADVGSAAGNRMKTIGNRNRRTVNEIARKKMFVANLNAIPE
ncbi:N-acetylglucosamine-1-phosphotransferase subunits alpha/beta [Bienertia sinuspersici]